MLDFTTLKRGTPRYATELNCLWYVPKLNKLIEAPRDLVFIYKNLKLISEDPALQKYAKHHIYYIGEI
jgi:hypothetical protein